MGSLVQAVRNLGGVFQGRRPVPTDDPERRTQARVSKRLSVHILGQDLISTNVTETGLQVACPTRWIQPFRDTGSCTETPARVGFPDGTMFHVTCNVVYVSPCEDEFLVGLGFTKFDESGEEIWQAYIDLLKSNGVKC